MGRASIQNAPNISPTSHFYVTAFNHTHIVVQALSVLTIISLSILRAKLRASFSVLIPARGYCPRVFLDSFEKILRSVCSHAGIRRHRTDAKLRITHLAGGT